MKVIKNKDFSFHDLVQAIQLVHDQLAGQAAKAVNVGLTMRNWTIGMYISEYELKGADRAEYGEKLLLELSKKLKSLDVAGTGRRQLYNYLTFYRTYPEIVQTVPAQMEEHIHNKKSLAEKVRTPSALLSTSPKVLIESLS